MSAEIHNLILTPCDICSVFRQSYRLFKLYYEEKHQLHCLILRNEICTYFCYPFFISFLFCNLVLLLCALVPTQFCRIKLVFLLWNPWLNQTHTWVVWVKRNFIYHSSLQQLWLRSLISNKSELKISRFISLWLVSFINQKSSSYRGGRFRTKGGGWKFQQIFPPVP